MRTLLDAFNRMVANKQVRITPEYRAEMNKVFNGYFKDQWFYIQAVNCDDTVTLCGDYHTILEGTKLSQIKF